MEDRTDVADREERGRTEDGEDDDDEDERDDDAVPREEVDGGMAAGSDGDVGHGFLLGDGHEIE